MKFYEQWTSIVRIIFSIIIIYFVSIDEWFLSWTMERTKFRPSRINHLHDWIEKKKIFVEKNEIKNNSEIDHIGAICHVRLCYGSPDSR